MVAEQRHRGIPPRLVSGGRVRPHPHQFGSIAIAWTSPDDGTVSITGGIGHTPTNLAALPSLVSITGGIWEGRDIGRSNVWSLTKNGLPLTDGSIASGDAFDSSNPFDFLTGSGGSSAVTGISVSTGDIFRLVVNATHPSGDYVVVDLTFTQSETIPEPATLAIFGIGLAALGLMARRRRLN